MLAKGLSAKKKEVQKLIRPKKSHPYHIYRTPEKVWVSLYSYKCNFSNTWGVNVIPSKDNGIKKPRVTELPLQVKNNIPPISLSMS